MIRYPRHYKTTSGPLRKCPITKERFQWCWDELIGGTLVVEKCDSCNGHNMGIVKKTGALFGSWVELKKMYDEKRKAMAEKAK